MRLWRAAEARPSLRPVAVAWLILAFAVSVPYLHAVYDPPPGKVFVGTFHWIDDYSNYLSYARQAEDGRFLFENRLQLEPHDGVLVNVEWWVVGVLSRALGRRPFLAFRVLGLLVLALLLRAVDRELRLGGLPASSRLLALLLVGSGGGVGGLLFELTARPAARCADLSQGIFPFLSALANPHWLVGTWLLLESVAAFSRAATRADILRGLLLAMVLGLSRPYDMVLLVLVQVAAVLIRRPAGEWARSLLPLTGLLPVVAYLYWVFFAIARFRGFSGVYYHPPPLDLLLALGPALALAIWAVRSGGGSAAPEMRLRLWLWTALGVLVTASGAVRFSLQFGVGAGLPLLMLGAWGLPRLGRRGGLVLVAAFATTAVVALRIVMAADPHWFVAAERRQAVLALREQCSPGDVVMGPEDLGLQMLSLTACRPFLAHPVSPHYESRSAAVTAFYTSLPASERRRLLEIAGVRHVLLPGRLPAEPTLWLGTGSGFERTALVGEGEAAIGIYSRVP